MAARIDKDILLKYADKAFLAVAVVFLAIVGYSLLGRKAPTVRYETVVGEYDQAVKKQSGLFKLPDNYDADVRTLLGLPEGDLANVSPDKKGDVEVYYLLVSVPSLAKTFADEHMAQAPAWADRTQWDPYLPQVLTNTSSTHPWLLPTKLVAPTTLVLIQDKGYQPSGKEKDKQFGNDLIYISGQARLNLGQQTLWSREAAPDSTTINATLPTDYQVQRRQKMSDGSWGDWQPRATVRLEQVKNQPAVPRVKELEAKALDGTINANAKKTYVDAVRKFQSAIQSRAKDLLHPPFYKMAGKEWLQPYEVRKVSDSGATGELSAEDAGPATATAEQTDLWFTDEQAASDVGKTFQYRVRIKFFNPIFNGPTAQTKPEERYLIEIPGAWSEPSAAITVAPLVRFYFTSKFNTATGVRANVELHAWKHGWWYHKKSATFDLGDPIIVAEREDMYIPGGENGQPVKLGFQERIAFDAGATVVDLGEGTTRSSGNLRPTERLLYWNNLANRLESRLAWDDKNQAGLDQKKEEAETGKSPAPEKPLRPVGPIPGPRQPPPSSAMRPSMVPPPPLPPPGGRGMFQPPR